MASKDNRKMAGPPQGFYLPADLSEWMDKRTLVRLILNVVQAVDDRRLDRAASPYETKFLPPRLMLTLLTYCYAAGFCGSNEIEEQSDLDETIRYLCARQRPGADFIRRFRNKNRELITRCLEAICLAVWRRRFSLESNRALADAPVAAAATHVSARLLPLHCACEARERLSLADAVDRLGIADELGVN